MIECPHCGSLWGFEEIDWNHCDCCGWPNIDDDDDDDDDEFDPDDLTDND